MKLRLEQHHTESRQQARRLEDILDRHGTSTSGVKNTATAVMGNVAAALHVPASDEVLKNTFANFAFEHQEIAAYTSLIVMARNLGDSASIPLLEQSLAEEERMAEWIRGNIVSITERFMQLSQTGQRAGV
jgi:ferritin-like metal-binding protein YciE